MKIHSYLVVLGSVIFLAHHGPTSAGTSVTELIYTELAIDVSGIICDSHKEVEKFIDLNAAKYAEETPEHVPNCTELIQAPAVLFTTMNYEYMDEGGLGIVEIAEILVLDENFAFIRKGYTFRSWREHPSQ